MDLIVDFNRKLLPLVERPRRRLLATLNRGQGSYADYMKVGLVRVFLPLLLNFLDLWWVEVMPTPGVAWNLDLNSCWTLFWQWIDWGHVKIAPRMWCWWFCAAWASLFSGQAVCLASGKKRGASASVAVPTPSVPKMWQRLEPLCPGRIDEQVPIRKKHRAKLPKGMCLERLKRAMTSQRLWLFFRENPIAWSYCCIDSCTLWSLNITFIVLCSDLQLWSRH